VIVNNEEAGRSLLLALQSETGRFQVGVAAASMDLFSTLDHEHENVLHANEVSYYRSLHFQKRKIDFLLGRFAAKKALEQFLRGCDFSRIEIFSGVFHQPVVRSPSLDRLSVSITHSNGIALALAHSDAHPMGIDVEAIIPSRINVLASEMTGRERVFLDASGDEKVSSYTHAWTAKEALSKVLRLGLACPFEILELSFLKKTGSLREGRFANFGVYKSYCWEVGGFSISIVLPSTTAFEGPFSILEEFFLAAVPQPIYE